MIVISDIHGRTFWKEAVKDRETETIIFLGDYHDPYSHEGITRRESINNFKEIIEFKKTHMDNVILLVGNHDVHYLDDNITPSSRFDSTNLTEIVTLFEENRELFQLAYYQQFGDKKIIFTHAGITKGWYERISKCIGTLKDEELIAKLNSLFTEHDEKFYLMLDDVSYLRGGSYKYGSVTWADVHEHLDRENELLDYFQIFGHTQQLKDPIITSHIACLDCRKAFEIDEKGDIKGLE